MYPSANLERVSFAKGELWSTIHTGTAIICACLPIYRPLVVKVLAISNTMLHRYGTILGNHTSNPASTEYGPSVMDHSPGDKIGCTEVRADPTARKFVGPEGYSETNIAVTRTVSIV